MQVLLNDIDVTLKDLSANRGTLDFDTEIRNRLVALNLRVNAELFETHRILMCRYDELDSVTNALDSVLEVDAGDIEAIAFYESRKEQLVILTNELSDKLDAVKDNMKVQYVELSEEDSQAFAKANKWNIDNGGASTEFAKILRAL